MQRRKSISYSQALSSGIPQLSAPKIHSSPPPPSKLLLLPTELQKDIIEHLDLPSQFKLRLTNRHFHTLIPRPTHQTLLLAERTTWAIIRHLYSCMDCLRLRSQGKFATAMLNGPKGRNGKEPHKRFCVECGLKGLPRSRYSPGAEIIVEGKRFVLCKECKVYSGVVGCVGSGMCESCHGKWGCGEMCREKRVGARRPRRRREEHRWGRGWENMYEDLSDYDEYFWETHDPSD
jgi:hypothetical protein